MRITKKIAAGFGVLLVLVLLVGVVAIRTLENIENVNTKVLEEFPLLTEKIMDMRRHLVTGLKGCTSYFLTNQDQYWDEGQAGLAGTRTALEALIKELAALNFAPEHKKDLEQVRDDLARFNTVAQEAKSAEMEYKILVRAMVGQGNQATNLALQYQASLLSRLGDQPAGPEADKVRQLMLLAHELNASVAQTRTRASLGYLQNAAITPAANQELLTKDMAALARLKEHDSDPITQRILEQLENTLVQRTNFSNKGLEFHAYLLDTVEQLTRIETLLLDRSHVLVNTIRDRAMRTLAEQNQRTHETGNALVLFLGGTFILGVIFALLLMRHISAALTRCLNFAQAVTNGDLDQRLPVGRRDEMGMIAEAMNAMLDNLHAKIDEARQKEQEANEARQQAEEARCQSDEANKAKDDFLARMSHEIRTPMNAIIGLGHLCQQTRLDEQQRQYITKILSSANDLLGILNEILDFSKIEGGKLVLDCLPFHLSVVMDNLSRIMGQRSLQKGIAFHCHVDSEIPKVLLGDPLRLTQVLINLAGNGVKFTEKGSVSVEVGRLRLENSVSMLRFSIIDTGIGMAPEQYQNMFQPFVQADGSNTRRFGGTGLGLSISQRLVALMGGAIEAESNPQGGSIFRFTVPLQSSEGQILTTSPVLENLRALVVDDSLLTQQVVASNLASLGVIVSTVDSGKDALLGIAKADAADTPYSLIILDWRMPDMDGIETARRIRELDLRHTPPAMLMHSDYNLDEMLELGAEAGITTFLPKPATPAGFHKAILEVLGSPEAKSEPEGAHLQTEAAPGATRLLLVEDNEINQEIACELLKMAQLDVDTVNNGQEAVEAVEKQAYALIFMDVQMPIMDGLEATRRIRAAGHRMPIIAMTAHAMRGDKEISLAAGMNDHLTKPLNPEALFAALNQWMPVAAAPSEDGKPVQQEIAPRSRSLPESIDGFNLTAGLAAVGGNEELYAGLLSKFAGRYATITEDITACLQSNDLETAVRLAHTVKGIAANLGAEALAEAAGTLEKTITHDPSMTTPHLKTLVLRLADAVTAVWTALGYAGTGSDKSPKEAVANRLNQEGVEKICQDLEASIANMEMDWSTAADVVQAVLDRLQGTELEEKASLLVQAVEDFETQSAQEISQKLQMSLRFACTPTKEL